jgi:hypothetical protein
MVMRRAGLLAEAAKSHAEALRILEHLYGPDGVQTLPALNNLATVWCEQGRRTEATEMLRRAVRTAERALGPGHPSTEHYRRNLGIAEDC